jgi:hypothetical protein
VPPSGRVLFFSRSSDARILPIWMSGIPSMSRELSFVIVICVLAACESPSDTAQQAMSPVEDTLIAVDSIGALTGDSCYVFGEIADVFPMRNGKIAVLDNITVNAC